MTRFVILDRDGVINEDSAHYIKSPGEWRPIPGSLEAISKLTAAGYKVFVATNQAGVGRGILTLASLDAIHDKMLAAIRAHNGAIEAIESCIHHPNDNCECRKPRPGMLNNLAETHHLALDEGYFVGDSAKDLEAAHAAGCQPVLVLTGNGKETKTQYPHHKMTFPDLAGFVKHLLSQ